MKTVIINKDKLLRDCVELKHGGWLHNHYEVHLTEDFKNISQLDGEQLYQALIAYRHNPNPDWIPEVSFYVAAALVECFLKSGKLHFDFGKVSLSYDPFLLNLLHKTVNILMMHQSLQETLNTLVNWWHGKVGWSAWRKKPVHHNIKFILLESLIGWQKNLGLTFYPPLYRLTEAVKKQIESRIPEQELKAIQEIKYFEEKVNTLVRDHGPEFNADQITQLQKDKLLSDCVELKHCGKFHNRYEIHLTEDFKHISPLDGEQLKQALIAYRPHPATLRDPNPGWITKGGCILGIIVGASCLAHFEKELTISNAPFVILFCFMMSLAAQQKSVIDYSRGENTRTSWRQKFSYNNELTLLELLIGWQKNSKIIIYLPPLYRLTEAVKNQIESRIPKQELKAIQQIKHFEEKVNTLVNKHNRRQSWCEWLSFGFLFRNQRSLHDTNQAAQLQLGVSV